MRLALFGGTFDPIHSAHLSVAAEACDAFDLDAVWFVPNSIPPHKDGGTHATWEQRYRMVELACEEDERFHASRLEEAQRTSYTIHTLEAVRSQLQPEDEIFFLIGADAFADIGLWFRKEDVFSMVEFLVVSRPGHEYEVPEGARIRRLESVHLDISSSDIRKKLSEGDFHVEVPEKVLAFIREHRVYTSTNLATSRRAGS